MNARIQDPPEDEMVDVLERNIATLVARRRAEEAHKSLQDQVADKITRFTGSMTFVYLHILFFGTWILVNLGWTPLPQFDPSFVVLAMVASVEAIFLSTFVLISQNRMAALSDKRNDLDLQISLLAEHEVTRILELVIRLADRLEVEQAHAPELQALTKDVRPEAVLDKLEEHAQQKDE
jgi:uncharacterized membrane protein